MPVYNAERFIEESVVSVINQTYRDWELIVVDDGSTDGTVLKLQQIEQAEPRLRVFTLPINSGSPAYPRNAGIEKARGRYIAFIDGDDRWLPKKLEYQVATMELYGNDISCTSYYVINTYGERIGHFEVPSVNHFEHLLSHNTMGCLTVMYDCEKLGKQYFPKCGHEDFALWLEITRSGIPVHGIQKYLAEYRLRTGAVSSNKAKLLSFFWHIYRRRMGFGFLRSIWFCFLYGVRAYNKYSLR